LVCLAPVGYGGGYGAPPQQQGSFQGQRNSFFSSFCFVFCFHICLLFTAPPPGQGESNRVLFVLYCCANILFFKDIVSGFDSRLK
jgi:hypothetical protein